VKVGEEEGVWGCEVQWEKKVEDPGEALEKLVRGLVGEGYGVRRRRRRRRRWMRCSRS
jgi:hypothetical protein